MINEQEVIRTHLFAGDDDQARLEVRLHLRAELLPEVQERSRPSPTNPSPYPPSRRSASKKGRFGQKSFEQFIFGEKRRTAVAGKAEVASVQVLDRRRR